MEFGSFVLAASTADLADAPRAAADADAIEFRLDLAEAPLDQLAGYRHDLPVIATNRVEDEGGAAPATPARLDTLVDAMAHGSVEAVDVELAAVEAGETDRLLDAATEHDVSVIVSAHDFESTPGRDSMASTLRSAAAAGDVGKLAVTAAEHGDVLDLLAVTWTLSTEDVAVATMAMGEPGRHSRAVAPVYGSRIGYAPVDPAAATAPGQYELSTLRTLVDALTGV